MATEVMDELGLGEEIEQPLTEGAEGDGQQQDGADGDDEPITDLFDPEGKAVNPAIRSMLAKLKTEKPDAAKLITNAVYRFAELQREFPGGMADVRELRDGVEKLGGLTGIEAQLEAARGYDGLAGAFEKADPAFVQDLVESYPDSFSALAPEMFRHYAELNPEGYRGYIARVLNTDFQRPLWDGGLNLPATLMLIERDLADKPQALELVKLISAYVGQFSAMANKAPANPRAAAAKPGEKSTREQDLERRESEQRAREFLTEANALRTPLYEAAKTKALAGRTLTEAQGQTLAKAFKFESSELANKLFPGWAQKAEAFAKAGNKQGYLRYIKSVYERVVPSAMASAMVTVLGRGRGTVTPPKGGGPLNRQNGTGVTPPAGYKSVARMPEMGQINFKLTSQAMVAQNRAILTDGSKVTWRD